MSSVEKTHGGQITNKTAGRTIKKNSHDAIKLHNNRADMIKVVCGGKMEADINSFLNGAFGELFPGAFCHRLHMIFIKTVCVPY